MHVPLISRAKATNLAVMLVAVALCFSAGGITAVTASAAVTVVPAAPSGVSAFTDGGTGVVVSWDWVSGGPGDDAASYTVVLDDGIPSHRRTGSGVEGDLYAADVLSVLPGTYTVTVTAVNAVGSSPASAATSYVAALDTDDPSEPLNVVAHNAADGVVQITWDAPVSEGTSPIEEYQVSLQYPNSFDPSEGAPYGVWNGQIIDGSGREFTFRQLEFNHGDFIVTVNAVNSSRYPGYEAITDPAPLVRSTVPSAPTQVSATSPSANTVTVIWNAPASDGGFPVTDYLVTFGQNFGMWTSGTDRTATITDVPAGSESATVFAYNVNGESPAGTASQVSVLDPTKANPTVVKPPVTTTVAGPPSPPRSVAVATHPGGKAVVTYRVPRYLHHRAITRYMVKLAGQRKIVDAGTRTVTFRGLTKGNHTVRVYARNKAGRSRAAREHLLMPRSKAAARRITLKLGMLGWSVRQVQVALKPSTKPQMGTFDDATRNAVLQWQRTHGKELTGMVNADMRLALGI